ncbi:DUF7857 domain-containing protein [Halopenitus persicus]|uniref:DUF7857 domain-containing protein n=1 Tax=Halopenitus persicus TaxID=1048396 RepID=UPI000BBABDC5|nr:hypothetical protein [Halopenitus persicus]
MDLSWNVERRGGLAVVTCVLCNDAPAEKRVRLRNDLEGPVVPPRRRGVPESGWDRDGYTCRVNGNSTVGFGYVCPALTSVDRRPMTIESVEDVDDEDDGTAAGGTETDDAATESAVASAIRTLDDHRPPRGSVPSDGNGGGGEPVDAGESGKVPTEETPTGKPPTEDGANGMTSIDEKSINGEAPARIEDRIDAVGDDLDRLGRLTDADLETAASVVAESGDLQTLESDVDRLAAAIDELRTLRDRIDEVIERHDRLETPIEALRRIA